MSEDLIKAFSTRHGFPPDAERELRDLVRTALKESIITLTSEGRDALARHTAETKAAVATVAQEVGAAPQWQAETRTFVPEPSTGPRRKPAEGEQRESLLPASGVRLGSTFQMDPEPHSGLPGRYELLARIGEGGMGEVLQVLDRALNRKMAMKIIRTELVNEPEAIARFIEEAQITAQLQHPGIVPVHDIGTLRDGRMYFTMKEVNGRTFSSVIQEVQAATRKSQRETGQAAWAIGPSGWSFRKLIDAFHRVCEAVAYAHARGVIHRDLKPVNIMVGDFGEVLVLDWGIAKLKARPALLREDEPVITERSQQSVFATTMGTVAGTPAYMPIEQATGQVASLGYGSDVYALGAIMYEILSGKPPYSGETTQEVWRKVLTGAPKPLEETAPVPQDLREICETAMAREIGRRYEDAGVMAREIGAWLEGLKRREHAMNVVAYAEGLKPVVSELLTRATDLEKQAAELEKQVPPFAPAEVKKPRWDMEDEAASLRQEALLKELELTQNLRAALTHAPDLPEAHAMLAEHYQRRHADAEAKDDKLVVTQTEVLLRSHDNGHFKAYLQGNGALSLRTSPEDAEVDLYRYEQRDRRLVPVFERSLGRGPLRAVELEMGSYLLKLRAEGRHEVNYPVYIRRLEHWDGTPEGETEPFPIVLPRLGEIGADEVYVPAGWFLSGGDPQAHNGLPRQRLWVDAFVIGKNPITVEQYLVFLNDLVAQGREEEALQHAPPTPAWELARSPSERSELGVERNEKGLFELRIGHPRWPIAMINWHSATAYIQWHSRRRGVSFRLPAEMEWEKAARGVDGRPYPWGSFLDPSFCHMRFSHKTMGRALRTHIDACPVDESPYGVRGMAGNVRDWCQDAYQVNGPKVVKGRPVLTNGEDLQGPGANGTHRLFRGGCFQDPSTLCRTSYRDAPPGIYRDTNTSFRFCAPYAPKE